MSLGLGLTRAKNDFTPDRGGDDDPCVDPGCEEGKTWNTEVCACVCTEEEECEIGYEWNPESCRCERR